MRRTPWKTALLAASAALHFACSSGGGSSSSGPGTDHVVTLSWTANRETGVNMPGGGYIVSIPGQPDIDVPYVSGPLAPTSTDLTLRTGSYTVTVTAYAALDAQGGMTGSRSAPSQSITVNVP